MSGPPALFEWQLSLRNSLRGQLINMTFLTDMHFLFLRRDPIPDLLGNLIPNFPLVNPLRNKRFLLLRPPESLLKSHNLISLSIQKRKITDNTMQPFIVHGLILIRNLIIPDPTVIVIQFVDQIVVFLLVFQIGVRG